MIIGLQIFGILFSLVMIYFTYVYYKRNNYSKNSFILWTLIWIGFGIMVLFPKTIYGIMEVLQIQRTVDFFVISGFLFFAVILFYLWIVVKRNERKLENLVRNLAINEPNTNAAVHPKKQQKKVRK